VLFDINEIQFAHFISILSVLRHQKPDEIIIHCNCDQLNGINWRIVRDRANSSNTEIRIRKVSKINQIFNIPLRGKWQNWHSSDITRIKVLMEFGGIYLDNDIYVVKPLDTFRKFEMTLNWDFDQYLGNQVIIANRNARFLKLWLDSYRYYDENKWYFNAGELPTKAILTKYPHLIHRLTGEFGVNGYQSCYDLYRIYLPNWREKYYAIHLYMRDHQIVHYWCISLALKSPVMYYDEENVKHLKITFAEMARLVLYNSTHINYR
jgi:mannosyltransferase OCH1-like enzyme